MDLQKIFTLARLEPFEFDVDYFTKMDALFTCISEPVSLDSIRSDEFEIKFITDESEPVQYSPISDKMVGEYFSSNKVIES